jgi:hypothetical protein
MNDDARNHEREDALIIEIYKFSSVIAVQMQIKSQFILCSYIWWILPNGGAGVVRSLCAGIGLANEPPRLFYLITQSRGL